ncbi:nitrate- and nitrite sensing domain-containing protein [Nocardiopsis composta]
MALTTVMQERSVTVAFLEHPEELTGELDEAQAASDEKMGDIITEYDALKPLVEEGSAERIEDLQESYSGIDELRAKVEAGDAERDEVLDFYGAVTRAAADLFDDLSRNGINPDSMGPGISATSTFRAVDALGLADAQLVRSFTEDELSHPDLHAFIGAYDAYRARMDETADFLGPEQRKQYRDLVQSDDYKRLEEYVEQIVARHPVTETDPVTGETVERFPMPVEKEEWDAVFEPVFSELTDIGANEALYAGDQQAAAATRSITLAVIGSVGMAVLVVLAFTTANRSALRLVSRLHRLRDDSRELTETKLPGIMDRLRRNEPVQVDSELSSLEANQTDDEIGQVAHAFDTAQRTAVEAAVRQAELREGVNRVFLSIAHRSQTLIHRQLRLLDRMERDQEDPAQLTELFKLDHLATRSRRNAENLLILGGENPGRTWHRPMPLVDVVRGAISESGDYTRVQRNHIARVSVVGPAVADVIHLVAELVDNATTFSPPHTRVMLSSEQVPNGVSIEIEDRGLGMQEDEFEAANALLSDPPEFDVMRLNEKMRLGLFVVSRLARRHDIKVWLRSSPTAACRRSCCCRRRSSPTPRRCPRAAPRRTPASSRWPSARSPASARRAAATCSRAPAPGRIRPCPPPARPRRPGPPPPPVPAAPAARTPGSRRTAPGRTPRRRRPPATARRCRGAAGAPPPRTGRPPPPGCRGAVPRRRTPTRTAAARHRRRPRRRAARTAAARRTAPRPRPRRTPPAARRCPSAPRRPTWRRSWPRAVPRWRTGRPRPPRTTRSARRSSAATWPPSRRARSAAARRAVPSRAATTPRTLSKDSRP